VVSDKSSEFPQTDFIGNGGATGFIGENIYKKQGIEIPPPGLKFWQIQSGKNIIVVVSSTLDYIQKSVTDELKRISTEAFQHCYEQWKQRLRRCVAAQGNYFEGDNLDL